MTKLTWENAILISKKTAKAIGLRNEIVKGILAADVVRATLAGQTVEAPVLIAPGHVDFAVSLPLGYGQEELGPVAKLRVQRLSPTPLGCRLSCIWTKTGKNRADPPARHYPGTPSDGGAGSRA